MYTTGNHTESEEPEAGSQPGSESGPEDRQEHSAAEAEPLAEAKGPEQTEESGPGNALQAPVKPLVPGQIVDGLIVHIDEHGVLVDVGTKSEGFIPAEELSGSGGSAAEGGSRGNGAEEAKPLEVGDQVSVYVVRTEDEEGHPLLSKTRADYERVWRRVTEAHERGDVLSAMVTERVRGGLVVDLGLRGFLPASHVRTRNVHALDRFVGQSLRVKVIEIDRARKRVVVSHKDAIEQERQRRREKTIASLEESKIYRGIVRRTTNYGAFVDLGGVDGLLHITEMSWTRIEHPSEMVKVGDKIDVMVLRFDREQNRISLGLKQILPDPWEDVAKRYKVGQIVTGTVSRVVPFGVFLRLENGIEGIVPNSELPGERGQGAQGTLSAGQQVQAKIVNIRANERRMTLSMRQVQQAKERQEMKEFMERQREASRVTIGDLFGSMLAETQAGRQTDEEQEQATEETPAPAEAETPEEKAQEEPAGSSEGEEWSSSESPVESEAEKD